MDSRPRPAPITREIVTLVASVQEFGPREKWPHHVVYVGMAGKASRAFGIPDAECKFGKPWALLDDPRGWPAAYAEYLARRLMEPAFAEAVKRLHGRTLLCWCTAKERQRGETVRCHARILAEMVDLLNA